MQWRQNRRKRPAQQIDSARPFEHADRHQHRHQKWNDLENYAEAFLRALDKLLINFHPTRRRVEREKAEQKWDRQDRQRVHAPDKNVLRGDFRSH